MSSLTSSFTAAVQKETFDSFTYWFLVFLFLDITDAKRIEKKKKAVPAARAKPVKMAP